MGEYADWTLQQFESEDLYFDNVMYEEETDSYIGPSMGRRRELRCKFCGKSGLQWEKTLKRWIMCEADGSIHDCPKNPLSLKVLKEIAQERMQMPTKIDLPEGVPFDNYVPPSWNEWFMKIMYIVASKSKDPRTKIGALLVNDRRILSTGYNGICRGVNDNVEARKERPEKYHWFEHAERNSIYSAASYGLSTIGTIMYTNGVPCTDCARGVIQAGIKKVVVHKIYDDLFEEIQRSKAGGKWEGYDVISKAMLNEAGVEIEYYAKPVGAFAYLDGKKYVV